jgi:hypothetical protein
MQPVGSRQREIASIWRIPESWLPRLKSSGMQAEASSTIPYRQLEAANIAVAIILTLL